MSAPHTLLKWLVHFRYRSLKVQGAMGLHRMRTERTSEVTRPPSVTCTNPYNGCMKMPFVYECSPYIGEVALAFLESYIYCTKRYGTAQHVYRTYGTGCVLSLWLR